jgi:transposase/DNA-binding CsgD family transcriptional regulator
MGRTFELARTPTCRECSNPDLPPPSSHPAILSNEALLLRLNRAGETPLDAKTQRKLEAVIQLLQRAENREIEDRAKASLRTVQRWTRKVREFEPEALHGHARTCTSSKLSESQRARLAFELERRTTDGKGTQSNWSAARLMRHISENYGVRFSLRHCRRLLASLGATERRAVRPSAHKQQASESAGVPREAASPAQATGDYARKHRALARIKRLACSGLPLQVFAYALFDLVHDAVPYDETSPGIAVETNHGTGWITRNFDYARWFPSMQKYLLNATPEISGLEPQALLPSTPFTVLCHEQIARPSYHHSEGYNEFFRPLGMHHGLLTVLRDEERRFLGYYPVFRSERMKPFGRDDFAFFNAAAALIAYGAKAAAMITATQTANSDTFEPFRQIPQGLVVMDRSGKVLSLNRAAHSIFRQFALYDGWGSKSSIDDNVETLSCRMASRLRAVFDNYDSAAEADAPVVRIYSHRSGATLRLRGYASDLGNGELFCVLIELGETEYLLRRRLALRYALSPRQAELLMLLRRGANTNHMAEALGSSSSGLKSLLRELLLKLDLHDTAALRRFAATSG